MPKSRNLVIAAVRALITVQVIQIVSVIQRDSLTFDESDHMYAGSRMWKHGDFGLNPKHPPLVKLLATLPVLGENLWVPPLKGIYFKGEAYLGGQAWLEHNDGGSQRLVFRMRLAAALLAVGLSLVVFFATSEWFGATAALVALTLVVFDPNILARSGLVTTDVGATLFYLATIWTFFRHVKQPTLLRPMSSPRSASCPLRWPMPMNPGADLGTRISCCLTRITCNSAARPVLIAASTGTRTSTSHVVN